MRTTSRRYQEGDCYTHIKTGNDYRLITITNLHATKPSFVTTMVYRDQQGKVWSRTLEEFEHKFTPSKELVRWL